MDNQKYFTIDDSNGRLLIILKTFITYQILDKWDNTNINTLKNNETFTMQSSLYNNENNGTFLNIASFKNKKSRKSKKGGKKLKIHYTLPHGQEIQFVYKDNQYNCLLTSKGDEAIEVVGGYQFFQELVIKTAVLQKDFDIFINDAIEFYEKNYNMFEDTDNTIRVQFYCDNYWETLTYRPERKLSTIYLPKSEFNSLLDDVTNFYNEDTKQEYLELGIPYKRNYLFEGKPGTGKTSLITAIASKFEKDIAILSFNEKFTDVDLMRAIRTIPDDTILVMEDIDTLFQARKKNDEHKNKISFSGLLNSLDGLCYKFGLQTIMTTNHKLNLDPALIRAGRIDYMMTFDNIKKSEMKTMFLKFMFIENDTEDYFTTFWNAYKGLSIRITTSILQQYLTAYIRKPQEAIQNIDELKTICDNTISSKEKQLYI